MADTHSMRTQETFRVLLQAMSHPGRVYDLPGKGDDGQSRLMDILETLLDGEVTFALVDSTPEMSGEIERRTRSHPAAISSADFVVVPRGTTSGEIAAAKRGTLEYPDSSATVIYCIDSFDGRDGGASLALKGPGIARMACLAVRGLDGHELHAIREANGEFPFGIDAILVDRTGRVACIPRSVSLVEVS